METPAQAPLGPISGNAPLYVNPEPLNPEQHGKLGVTAPKKAYSFAKEQHFVPLLATEFLAASCCFPIIFAGNEYAPLAIMGLNPGENIFYDDDGAIKPYVYVPAYIRRYPFTAALDSGADRMVICIDRGASLVGEKFEAAFFENGEPTAYTQQCIDFCQNFEADRTRTQMFVDKMKAMDLFEHREASFQAGPTGSGEPLPPPQVVAGFNAISEAKLNALSGEQLKELRDLNYLHIIYAHLTSMVHWDRLIGATLQRRMEEQQAEATKAKKSGKKAN